MSWFGLQVYFMGVSSVLSQCNAAYVKAAQTTDQIIEFTFSAATFR